MVQKLFLNGKDVFAVPPAGFSKSPTSSYGSLIRLVDVIQSPAMLESASPFPRMFYPVPLCNKPSVMPS